MLLRRAFPEVVFVPGVQRPPPTTLDEAQRAYVLALVDNEQLWGPTNGSAHVARMYVGLPNTRAEVLALLGRRPSRRWLGRRR